MSYNRATASPVRIPPGFETLLYLVCFITVSVPFQYPPVDRISNVSGYDSVWVCKILKHPNWDKNSVPPFQWYSTPLQNGLSTCSGRASAWGRVLKLCLHRASCLYGWRSWRKEGRKRSCPGPDSINKRKNFPTNFPQNSPNFSCKRYLCNKILCVG